MTKSKGTKSTAQPSKLPKGAAARRVQMLARQHFEAIPLSLEPMSAESCRNRDIAVRCAIAFLGKSSDELHAATQRPGHVEALLDVMEKSKKIAEWMRTTAGFLDTAGMRMRCVISRAFVDHPEWAYLSSAKESGAERGGAMSLPQKRRKPYPTRRQPRKTPFTSSMWARWLGEQPWASANPDEQTVQLRKGIEYRMLYALDQVGGALRNLGYAPR